MDYFNNVRAMFQVLDRGRVRERPEFLTNSLICVPKMSEGLTGLVQHEGE